MKRCGLIVAFFLALAPANAWGQPGTSAPSPAEEKGTYLGVLFGPVHEALYDQLPILPRGQGVLVTFVLPDSPAAAAGLRRSDVLLKYGDEKIRDCEHFARLVRDDKPDRKVKLLLVRGGRETTAEVTLTLGPVLRLAKEEVPRALAKPNGPLPVSVSAAPLDQGKFKVIVEYYEEGTGQPQKLECSGRPDEIDKKVQELPSKVQNLTRAALERLRKLDSTSKNAEPTPPSRRRP